MGSTARTAKSIRSTESRVIQAAIHKKAWGILQLVQVSTALHTSVLCQGAFVATRIQRAWQHRFTALSGLNVSRHHMHTCSCIISPSRCFSSDWRLSISDVALPDCLTLSYNDVLLFDVNDDVKFVNSSKRSLTLVYTPMQQHFQTTTHQSDTKMT
jgi:hypothetical protein